MSTNNNYNSEEQTNGAPKGSANNPYTVSEYNEMLINGTWKGGFVQGMGYVLQDVVVKGSKHTSNGSGFWGSIADMWDSLCSSCSSLFGSDNEDYDTHPSHYKDSESDMKYVKGNPYPQGAKTKRGFAQLYSLVENVGLRASFNYIVGIKIEGYTLFVGSSYSPSNFTDRSFTAKLVVTCNNQEMMHSLTPSAQGDIVQLGYKLLGGCTVTLPQTGNVNIKLNVVFEYDSGTGHSNGRAEIPVYP